VEANRGKPTTHYIPKKQKQKNTHTIYMGVVPRIKIKQSYFLIREKSNILSMLGNKDIWTP